MAEGEAQGEAEAAPNSTFQVTDRYRSYVLFILLLVAILNFVDRQVFGVLLESIKQEFALSDTELGLLGGAAFGLFYATLGIPIAQLADTYNRRNILSVALALWSGMTALCGAATGFWSLFLARVGVGVGEAGGHPPAQSIIADYYPPKSRARALAIYGMHLPLGILTGYMVGGWVNEFFGWKAAFLAVGLPGVLLALVVRLTLREPPRGYSDNRVHDGHTPPLADSLRWFWARRSARHLPIASSIFAISGWGAGTWLPAFFQRVHGLSSGEVGTYLALIYGSMGCLGAFLGGQLADRLVARTGNVRWQAYLSALAVLLMIPFAAAAYLAPTPGAALLLLLLPAGFQFAMVGPQAAMLQGLAGIKRRALATALVLLVSNLIALTVGPVLVGAVSDLYSDRYGADALRYSILSLVVVCNLWAAAHFACVGRTLGEDIARANED